MHFLRLDQIHNQQDVLGVDNYLAMMAVYEDNAKGCNYQCISKRDEGKLKNIKNTSYPSKTFSSAS
jgi:hypothetical protein